MTFTQRLLLHLALPFLFQVSTMVSYSQSSVETERIAAKIAEGVYVIRHPEAPDGFPQGNTSVIIGDRTVLVVDACYLPSSAREDIAQIRKWTDKPVRYLVNTHWHYDHTMGNGVYAEMFPSIDIIAHVETQKQIKGYNPGWFERYPKRADTFKKFIDTGKDNNGRTLTEDELNDYKKYIKGIEPVYAEYKKLIDRAPNISFTDELIIDLGNREVAIKHLGSGNTRGDVIIYLPAENIVVAGDLLDYPVPYLGGGYPSQLVKTLQHLAQLKAALIVPGHGEVLKGEQARAYLTLVTDFVNVVTAEVSKQIYLIGNGPRNLEPVREAVIRNIDVNAWRQKFAGSDKDNISLFDGFSFPGLVTAAYAEAWGR
jgi:cyclase